MQALAFLIAAYALVMLVLHVLTGKLLASWKDEPGSWISRCFTPRRVLRTEALFWLLALASWFLWQSLAWKLLVLAFAVAHFAVWAADEFAASKKTPPVPRPSIARAIVVFDLVEAVVLAGIAVNAVRFLTQLY